MALSLLSLPDEALHHIFLYLGSGTLYDQQSHALSRRCDDQSRGLANTSVRLNNIYRSSVHSLDLCQSYSAAVCARLVERFPRIDALECNFQNVPRRSFSLLEDSDCRTAWDRLLAAYPKDLVHGGTKSIDLVYGDLQVSEIEAMVLNCTGLQTLNLCDIDIYLDPEISGPVDGVGAFSLERHSATMENICFEDVHVVRGEEQRQIDVRGFHLASFSVLKSLELVNFSLSSSEFPELSALTSLLTLTLQCSDITDHDIEAFLPALPQLRSLDISECEHLSYRSLRCLPPALDYLGIAGTGILSCPPQSDAVAFSRLSMAQEGAKSVKTLNAPVVSPVFELFLYYYDERSIECLTLSSTNHNMRSCEDLVFVLSKVINLLELDIHWVQGLDASVYVSISKLSRLHSLRVRDTDISEEMIRLAAAGPCRHSLRRIDLSGCSRFETLEEYAGARQVVSDCFDICKTEKSW